MLARLSAHWPNFCEVFVKVMLGVMVLLMITWHKESETSWEGRYNRGNCLTSSRKDAVSQFGHSITYYITLNDELTVRICNNGGGGQGGSMQLCGLSRCAHDCPVSAEQSHVCRPLNKAPDPCPPILQLHRWGCQARCHLHMSWRA